MVAAVTLPSFRSQYPDSLGRGYVFTWFILDIVGYRDNPRRKAAGYHVVWDEYQRFLTNRGDDGLGWHFHTVPVGGHALDYNPCWTNNDYHERVLARRILQRRWFPTVFRAGGTIERNDLSLWLEQFIPFDFSSRSVAGGGGEPGALSDWRGAPTDWSPYHPDFYDYRSPGSMRRWIFRTLDVDVPGRKLSEGEVERAFRQVRSGESAVLSFTDHDRRDLRPDIESLYKCIRSVASGYPEIIWEYANAGEAARRVSELPKTAAPRFTFEWRDGVLHVESDQVLFGPQPFLALEEEGGIFYRDNLTVESATRWAYRPLRPQRTLQIGVAGCNPSGAVGVSSTALP